MSILSILWCAMDFEGKATAPPATKDIEFVQPSRHRQPLTLLRQTQTALRRPIVATLTPILPLKLAQKLQVGSTLADSLWKELAEINLEQISDLELRSARIYPIPKSLAIAIG